MEILKQDQYSPYPVEREIIELFAVKYGFLNRIEIENVRDFLDKVYNTFTSSHQNLIDELLTAKSFSPELTEQFKKVMEDYLQTYLSIR